MEDLVLRAEWNTPQSGKFEWAWAIRGGVDDTNAFLKGIKTNSQTITIPSQNLVGVDLKTITVAVKAKQGTKRYETEFSL